MSLKNKMFRTIYAEESALDYPLAQEIMARFSDSPVVCCRNYKDIFNRPNQNTALQKKCPALILASKKPPFYYEGPKPCQDFGNSMFFYANLATGCPYDCEYCFLQGLYVSGDIVVYVNTDEIFSAIIQAATEKDIYLALSHDSDLIALYGIVPQLIQKAHSFLTSNPQVTAELRTKSAVTRLYRELEPLPNLIIAFSLAPQAVIDRFEPKTSSLRARISAINSAIKQGFTIRICFDPVFINDEVDASYKPFFDEVFTSISPDKILDVSYGFFRLSKDHYQRMKKRRPLARFLADRYTDADGIITYDSSQQNEVRSKHLESINQFIDKSRIFTLP